MSFHEIAERVAKKGEDPNWVRTRSLIMTKMRPLFRELQQAAKNESGIEFHSLLTQFMDELGKMSKAYDWRSLQQKLKTTIKQTLMKK